MYGSFSMLNLDLALRSHEEQVAKAERRHAIKMVSSRSSRSRLSDVRRSAGSALISAGERLRSVECDRIADDIGADSVSLNLAR